jgi:hypothetical protein
MPDANDDLEITVGGQKLPDEIHARVRDGLKAMIQRELQGNAGTVTSFHAAGHSSSPPPEA